MHSRSFAARGSATTILLGRLLNRVVGRIDRDNSTEVAALAEAVILDLQVVKLESPYVLHIIIAGRFAADFCGLSGLQLFELCIDSQVKRLQNSVHL